MIDPLEPASLVVSLVNPQPGVVTVCGSFTAPQDITLRQVRITAGDVGIPAYFLVVGTDPDLTLPVVGAVTSAFQLLAYLDPGKNGFPVTETFENLALPLVKGTVLYLGSGSIGGTLDIFQLIFS